MSGISGARLDGFAPISLDELVERAALLARFDRKYVLPIADADHALALAPTSTRILEIDVRRAFGYRSTYLDTPDLDSYLVAGRARRRRWKVRTRSYLDTGGSWLEVKTRAARDQNIKERITHPDAELVGGLTPAGEEYVAASVGDDVAARLRPALSTTYQRSTLHLPESDSRVTVDTALGWTALPDRRRLDRPTLAIVETKTGSTPSAVDRLLWRLGHRPVRISKYGVGMAALHLTLPRLKWHHTLDHHLGVPRAA